MSEKPGPSKTAAQRSLELGSYFTEARLRTFSFNYKHYPQLWSKHQPQNVKTPHGAGACAGLASRARLPRGECSCERVLSLCRHFHRLLFQQLLIACSKTAGGAGARGSLCAGLPPWARYANGYLNMHGAAMKAYKAAKNKDDLEAIMESAYIPMPVHAAEGGRDTAVDGSAGARLVRALRRARARGYPAAARRAARALRWDVVDVSNLWSYLRKTALRKLRSLLRRGDRADSTPLDWAAADLAVYFGASVLAREHLKDEVSLVALLYTFHLVQRNGLEAPGAPPAPALWAAAAGDYSRSGHTCSALVLQRRWHELKKATQRALLEAWREPARPAPAPLLLAIARRYPHVVTEPACSWAEMARRGALARPTSERGPLPGEDGAGAESSDAESDKDDDLILVEDTIETINLDEDNDPKTPTINMPVLHPVDNTSSEPKASPDKNMPVLDSNPIPPDEETESPNNDPIFNENSQGEDTELRCDEDIPESPHSDNVVEVLKSLDVGAVEMTIQFDDDDEFDDENENRDGTEIVSESARGNGANDVTVKDKNQATISNETVNKTCDTGNDSQNVGHLKIRDVISMQIDSYVNKPPAIERTDERIKNSRRLWCESSDSDSDNLTIDPDYVPRDEDLNQGCNSHADNLNTHSSNFNKENVKKTTHLGNQPQDLNKVDKSKIDVPNVANNYLQNNSMVVDTEKLKESESVDKEPSTLDAENTSDEKVSNKIDKSAIDSTNNESNDRSSRIDETDFEKLDLDYVRSLVDKLLQSYGCHSESNEISKTDEQMSDKRTANVLTEAAQSGHVPNLRKLCENKIGSLLTSVKSDSSNNDTADVSKSKADSDLTEVATKKELINDKLEQELTSVLKNEHPSTCHTSVLKSGVTETQRSTHYDVIMKTAHYLYTVKGGPNKNNTTKGEKKRFLSGSSNIVNQVKELKVDKLKKPAGPRLKSVEEVVLFMAPNKEIVEKCATKPFKKIAIPNSSKASETCTSKDTTDSQTDLAKSTDNIPSSDNTVKGHVIKNPILLRMLKSQSCDFSRSLQFASRQNKSNNNATDIEDKTDDVLATEDEGKSEIDPKLLLFPVVELEKVNLAVMLRHWREIRRISLYDVTPSYLLKKNNLTLLKKCRPCGVLVERLDWEERESVGSRVAKKVELQNIDDVRRNNRNILTAQVAPITVDSNEARAAARRPALTPDDLQALLRRYQDCASDRCGSCARCLSRPLRPRPRAPRAPQAAAHDLEKERRNRARQRHKERNQKRPRSPYEEDPEEAKRRWIREKNIAAEKFGVKPRVLKKKAVEQPPPPPPPLAQTFGHLVVEEIDGLNKHSGNYVINNDGSLLAIDTAAPNTNNTSQNPPPLILNHTAKIQAPTFLPLTVENLLEHAKNQPIFKLDSNLFNPEAVASINKTLNDLTDTEPPEFNPVITNVQSLADTEGNRKTQNMLNNIVPQIRKRHFDSSLEEPPKKALNTTATLAKVPQGNALNKPTDLYPKFKIVTKNGEVKRDRIFKKAIPKLPNLIPLKKQALEKEREIARRQLSNLKTIKGTNVRRPNLEITPNLNQTNLQTVQTCSQMNLENAQSPDSDMQKTTPQPNSQNIQDSQGNWQTIHLQNAPWNVQSVQTSPQTNMQNPQSSNDNIPEQLRQINLLNAQTSQSIQAISQTNLQCAQNLPVGFQAQDNSQMNFQNVQINQQMTLQTQTNQVNYIWTNTQPAATVDLSNQIKILNHQLPTNQPTIPLQFNAAQQVSTALNSNFNVILSNSHQNTLQVNAVQASPLINSYLPNQLGLLPNQVMPLNSVQAGPSDNSVLVVSAQDNLNTLSPQVVGPPTLPVAAVQAGTTLQDSADKSEESVTPAREPNWMQSLSFQFRGEDLDPRSLPVRTAAQYICGRDPTSLALLAGRWPRGARLLLREAAADVPGPVFGLAPPCRILQDEETPATSETAKGNPPWLKVRSFARLPGAGAPRVAAPRRVFLHDKVYHKLADSPLTYAKVLAPLESARRLRALVAELGPLFVYCTLKDELYSLQLELSRNGSNIIISGPKEVSSLIGDICRCVLSQSQVKTGPHRVSSVGWMIPRRAASEDDHDSNSNSNGNGNKPMILNGQLSRGPIATLHYRPETASAGDTVIDLDSD